MPKIRYPNALYALLQVRSVATSATAGHTTLPVGAHLRHPGGLRIAALGLAAEHGTGTFALSGVSAVPIAISLSQRQIPPDLAELELLTTVRHKGRSIMVTSMEAFRPGDRSERLAFGTLTWSVLPPSPQQPVADGGVSSADGNLVEVAGIGTEGAVTSIKKASPEILGPGGVLHAGALQALAEQAALAAARHDDPHGEPPTITDATFHFVRAARSGPFVAQVNSYADGDTEVTIHDEGGAGRLCVLCTCKVKSGTPR